MTDVVTQAWAVTLYTYYLIEESERIEERISTLRDMRNATYHALAERNPKALEALREEVHSAGAPKDPGIPEWIEQQYSRER